MERIPSRIRITTTFKAAETKMNYASLLYCLLGLLVAPLSQSRPPMVSTSTAVHDVRANWELTVRQPSSHPRRALDAANTTTVPIDPILAKQWDILLAYKAQMKTCGYLYSPQIRNWPDVRPKTVSGWPGVTVKGNRIVAINFAGRDLCDPVPKSFSALTSLTSLDMSDNYAQDNKGVPPGWSSLTGLVSFKLRGTGVNTLNIPATWTKLTLFDLSSNSLSDAPYPPAIASFKRLAYLDLSSTQWRGPPPAAWSALTSLSHLELSYRDAWVYESTYRGRLSPTWSTLTRLTYLSLDGFILTAPAPQSWAALKNLKVLKFSVVMNGPGLPSSWGTAFTALTHLGFPDITWPGSAANTPGQTLHPSSWTAMKQLHNLYMPCNSLTTKPANNGIPLAAQITTLTVGLCGPVESADGGGPYLTKLHSLRHFTNILSLNLDPASVASDFGVPDEGTFSLPPEWSALVKLTSLVIRASLGEGGRLILGNEIRWQPILPPAWSTLTNLQTLVVDGHYWAWKFGNAPPPSWSRLQALTRLELLSRVTADEYGEGLRDDFPTTPGRVLPRSWGKLTRLQYLDLSDYGLTGMTLPSEWGAMKQLKVLRLGGNCVSGQLPPTWGLLTNLVDLTLPDQSTLPVICKNKKLVGALPNTWQHLTKLSSLQLIGHSLNGTLPAPWGTMAALKILTLRGNQLRGPIPASWSQLASLATLDVSHNKRLSGSLPLGLYMLKKLRHLDVSDNAFSGSVPPGPQWVSSGFWNNLVYVDLSGNQFTGKTPVKPKLATYFNTTGNKFVG